MVTFSIRFVLLVFFCFVVNLSTNEKKTNNVVQPKSSGCSPIIIGTPYLILEKKGAESNSPDVTFELFNNSTCSIILSAAHSQLILESSGKVRESKEMRYEDKALVTLKYFVNSGKCPSGFLEYWPYGHDATSKKILGSGTTISFRVPKKFVSSKHQIAIPFNYEWEDPPAVASDISHRIYSKYEGKY